MKPTTKCTICGQEQQWELVEVCYDCVKKKYGPFKTYKYVASLNFTPKQSGDLGYKKE